MEHVLLQRTEQCRVNIYLQGLVFEGGGEKKGILDGIVGMEGMFGSEVAGRGGKFSFGRLGMFGMVGSGGRVPGLGRDGCVVGSVGKGAKHKAKKTELLKAIPE
ncbi:hypothetical protein FEM48_Zijuj09G0202400 [Ziziphus jujuba var. spinosa]|uniref:Uncharacterized protein n=1 Tax=Ziziphus jujuba var. spinosa TaxID=714518 RepID=A0A978UV33_ZIZJJ|nr:hypothetical protein FEM48_Zijuj09G0202400 [Ziziphus jujuba var. spinosa]